MQIEFESAETTTQSLVMVTFGDSEGIRE